MEPSDAATEAGAEGAIKPWSPSTFLPPITDQKKGPLGNWEVQLDQWQQGHIAGPFPATWLAPVGFDDVTMQSTAATAIKPFYSEKVDGWCIIVSQTCDIGAKDTGGKQPFVLVAPLRPWSAYKRDDASLANAYQIPYLFPTLSPNKDKKDETWFADLRLVLPISKALLLDRKPISGLRENDALKFAGTIAHRFSRPALQDVLSEDLPASINKHILETRKRSSAYTQTEHIRLVVALDERLAAKSVYLMVLGKVALTQDEQDLWRQWEPKGKAALTPHGIQLGPTLFTTPEDCRASLYRAAVPLRIDNLTNVHWL
jgi:hypothetical protein